MIIATKKDMYMNTKQNLGWIGVGKMGPPMSTNLINAGIFLKRWDRKCFMRGRVIRPAIWSF
jgi:hypothetical protein